MPPMNGMETSICAMCHNISLLQGFKSRGRQTHKNDIKWPIPLHPRLESVHCKRPVLCNLDRVPVLLKNFNGQLLVDKVVFRE